MKVMVFVKATVDSEAGGMPTQEELRAMGEFNDSLEKAGILLMGEGLKPSRYGKRVRYSGKTASIIDGPFAETKELISGFSLWNVSSMEDALACAMRCPLTNMEIEIRPLFDLDDPIYQHYACEAEGKN